MFKEIRVKLAEGDWLTEKEKKTLEEIDKKYGLVDVYRIE